MVNSYGSISPTPPLMGLPSEKKSRGCSIGPVPAAVAVIAALLAGAAISWYFTAYGIGGSTKDTDLTADTGPTAAELRLPTSVIPESYDLTMKTYLPGYVAIPEGKNLTFEGQVKIKLSILQPVKKIVLNAKHLKFQESKCDLTVNGKSVKISEIMELPQFEKVAFHLEDALEPEQEVVLKVQYTGLISSDLGGLYQTVYTDKDGNQKIAAATQMEPTDARLMVPCMDEPAFKATWAVTVIHPTGTTAASNGIELETTTVDDDFLSTQFKTTPKMPSYLLAVIISEFQFIEKTTASGVRFRVWSRPEAKEHTMYALESGVKCLEYYEKFYNISFPMEKQDMFALPDFSAGAMENWGLITYRESAVLYDPKIYSSLQKRRVAIVIAHELAHQWFGNLVTMQWWEDLWLNEGFATYVEHIGADEISDGRFRMEDVFMSNDLGRALDADNKASSHPLSFKIDKASEVREAFDTISYQKGGSVLRMIRSLMGEDNFNKGVNNYLTIHKYANARAIDLWMALDGASPDTVTGPDEERLNITQFALQWTTQLGFPYLTLNRINSTSVEITQKRYKVNEDAKEKPKYANPEYKFKWDVPVWYQAGKAVPKLVWMKRDEPLQIVSDEAPIVLNAGSKAFMRQNYDKTEWKKIFAQMNADHTVYDVATRHAIVSDAFAMANVEKLDYELLFDLLSYMKKETNYFVTEALQKGLFLIRSYFGTEPESKIVQEYMKKNTPHRGANETITSISENNLDEEKMYENLLEVENFDRICQLGSVDCNSQMKQLFKTEVVDKCKSGNMTSECVSITPPLRQLAYCYGVRNGDEGTFEKIMGFYKREKSQIERNNLLEALTCSRDPTTLKSLLLISMDRDSNVIRFQDVRGLFYNVAKNDVGKEFIFNFFLSRWEHIYESFQSNYKTISTIVTAATKSIRTQSQIDQLKNFRASAEHAGDYNAVSQSIEEAGHRVQWIEKNMQKLTKLFKQRLADES